MTPLFSNEDAVRFELTAGIPLVTWERARKWGWRKEDIGTRFRGVLLYATSQSRSAKKEGDGENPLNLNVIFTRRSLSPDRAVVDGHDLSWYFEHTPYGARWEDYETNRFIYFYLNVSIPLKKWKQCQEMGCTEEGLHMMLEMILNNPDEFMSIEERRAVFAKHNAEELYC